jgi:hypothetical protein
MKRRLLLIILPVLGFVLFTAAMFPDEGMWLLNQLDKLPWKEMQKHGLELTPDQIYSKDAPSITDAIVLFGGGTSSFVSDKGLVLTNHHVAYAAIQSVSSVKTDYLRDGYYAKTMDDELSIPSYTAQIVVGMKDVTADVLSAVSDTMSAESRAKAIQAKSREIEKKEKGTSDNECRIAENNYGMNYVMYTYQVLRDIRLVYAPPAAIGNYGGEVDNWYWPRQTGDFSFMRVYCAPDGKPAKYSKQNVPYKPKSFLPISMAGYKEGDFEMIIGFPGRTFRYRTATEVQLSRDETLPLTIDLFKTRMDIMDAAGKKDRAVEIKYATRWRGLANTYKNFEGTLEGMKRADILKERHDREEQFKQFLATKPELQKQYGDVLPNIAAVYDDFKTWSKKGAVLGQLLTVTDLLGNARRFMDYAGSFAKDSVTGKEKPSDAKLTDLREGLKNTFKNFDLNVDKELLAAFILKTADLPYEQHVEKVQKIVGQRTGAEREKAVREFVDDLYKNSRFASEDDCDKMLEKSKDEIMNDDAIKFVQALDADNTPLQGKITAFNAKMNFLRGKLMAAWTAWKGPDLYPDANRTIRITYGEVTSYDPRDAVHYKAETTLSGVMEKETGEDPFIVPPKLRELWEKKDFGRYADPTLGDVPVAFLANLDITGGNSGSPVINGKGEISGLAFDGNWEAVVGDYLYQDALNRSINVDARYILFILDKYANAQNIMKELTIKGPS